VYWKRDGCKAFEKEPQATEELVTPNHGTLKRPFEQQVGSSICIFCAAFIDTVQTPLNGGKKFKRTTLDFEVITKSVRNAALEQQPFATTESRAKKSMIPDLLEYLKPLAEQMDPAAGIEDEYKLSKNKVSLNSFSIITSGMILNTFPHLILIGL